MGDKTSTQMGKRQNNYTLFELNVQACFLLWCFLHNFFFAYLCWSCVVIEKLRRLVIKNFRSVKKDQASQDYLFDRFRQIRIELRRSHAAEKWKACGLFLHGGHVRVSERNQTEHRLCALDTNAASVPPKAKPGSLCFAPSSVVYHIDIWSIKWKEQERNPTFCFEILWCHASGALLMSMDFFWCLGFFSSKFSWGPDKPWCWGEWVRTSQVLQYGSISQMLRACAYGTPGIVSDVFNISEVFQCHNSACQGLMSSWATFGNKQDLLYKWCLCQLILVHGVRSTRIQLFWKLLPWWAWLGGEWISEKMQWFCKAELVEQTSKKIAVSLQSGIGGMDFWENCKGLQSSLWSRTR